jgi:excisionase family DNA binding protein
MTQQYCTVEEAAAHLGVSTRTVERRIQTGVLTSHRLPKEGGGYRSLLPVEQLSTAVVVARDLSDGATRTN